MVSPQHSTCFSDGFLPIYWHSFFILCGNRWRRDQCLGEAEALGSQAPLQTTHLA